MTILTVQAPFDGWCSALEDVPDPVFAGRMLGDGLAIDPVSSVLKAPCAGEITTLPASAHAVAIRTPEGIEVLVHVGIDTVQLAGRGFTALVQPGALVRPGDELIRVDLDIVARAARSLLTPIVVTTTDGVSIRGRHAPGVVTAGEVLFEVLTEQALSAPGAAPLPVARPSGKDGMQRTLRVPLRHGLHARPAALLSQRSKLLDAEVAILAHGRSANARSSIAIMALGVRHGDEITICASGADAELAVAALVDGIEAALRQEAAGGHDATVHAAQGVANGMPGAATPARAGAANTDTGLLTGGIAVPGIAVGRATRIERRELAVNEPGAGIRHERAALDAALAQVRARLQRSAASGGAERREIVAAHVEFLDDPLLHALALEHLAAGKSAGFAWRAAIRRQVDVLEALEDPRLRERAGDLLDVESQVLLALIGEARPMHLPLPECAVLLADELLPSELTALDATRLAAICLKDGGATSHVAILAAAMNVPMLVGLGPGIRHVREDAIVIVDGYAGTLHTAPGAAAIVQAQAAVAARSAQRAAERTAALADCRTLDGTRIEVFANLGSVADATAAVANGAEGCGLLRTEFLFIDRDTAPDEAEQLAAYQGIATALEGRPLVLRLMDVGGDKPLRYLPLPPEQNPALGLRGVRTALARPDLLRIQLRAALRVEPLRVLQLLVPMVTDVAELEAVRAAVDALRVEIGDLPRLPIGAMIETPAAALTAAHLLREADFLSIGSNDLTQYALAMDRGHPQLARRADALHPAVLKLMSMAAEAGCKAGKTVAVCGGVAADRLAVPILIGIGVRELSVVPAVVPVIKRAVRALRVADCRALAQSCLELSSAGEVRALAERWLQKAGESR